MNLDTIPVVETHCHADGNFDGNDIFIDQIIGILKEEHITYSLLIGRNHDEL